MAERGRASRERSARVYELRHGEIFNPVEQARLERVVREALREVRTSVSPPHALDFGCGTGNLTRHLLAAGAEVTAADVSDAFLALVAERYGATAHVRTLRLGLAGARELPDAAFDLIGAYSVLHHVPDYVGALIELVRTLRVGGVLFIDHEASPDYWRGDERYTEWRHARSWRYYLDFVRSLTWSWPTYRFRRLRDPRAAEEGDLHVWTDDHVRWDVVRNVLEHSGCRVLREEDHLVYRRHHSIAAHERFRSLCSDSRMLVARREA